MWYKSVKKVYSPVLRADVIFNSKGFRHILYDGTGTLRSREERVKRLILIRHAPGIIRSAVDIYWRRKTGTVEFIVFRRNVRNSNAKLILMRVIIRKTISGNYFYYSVMKESDKQ